MHTDNDELNIDPLEPTDRETLDWAIHEDHKDDADDPDTDEEAPGCGGMLPTPPHPDLLAAFRNIRPSKEYREAYRKLGAAVAEIMPEPPKPKLRQFMVQLVGSGDGVPSYTLYAESYAMNRDTDDNRSWLVFIADGVTVHQVQAGAVRSITDLTATREAEAAFKAAQDGPDRTREED